MMAESALMIRRMQPHLGTFVEISAAVNSGQSHALAEQAITAAFAEIKLIHQLLSFHASDSDLTRLNQAQGKYVSLHRHSMRVLRLAKAMTALSDGLFNCTVGGKMVSLGVLPEHGNRHNGSPVLPSGTAAAIEFKLGKVRLGEPVKVTLDGIAKGYAVDCAVIKLKQHGVNAGCVNAGGDLKVFGDSTLPVQRRELDGSFSALGGLKNAALASSQVGADDGKRFPGKIVSPDSLVFTETNLPVIGVWSVMCHWAWRADALTKVASLASPAQSAEVLARLGGVLVTPKNQGVCTENIAKC